MTDEEQIQRGFRAKDLLENKTLTNALKATRDEILTKWEATPGSQTEEREWLWKLYHASKVFETLLLGYIENGKFLEKDLKDPHRGIRQKIRSIM